MQTLNQFEMFKLLADELRTKILRRLMAGPATLSQLGDALELHPANIRHHLVKLERAGLVTLVDTHQVRGFVEKYYKASANAYLVQMALVPDPGNADVLIAPVSHDLALEIMAAALAEKFSTPYLYTIPLGSLDGLIALRQGIGQFAGAHLYDPILKGHNIPFVRAIFPGQQMHMVTLCYREQGMILAPGNPLGIRNISDLAAHPEARMVNRNRGSGTRVWLDELLKAANIPGESIPGYEWEVNTHTQVAQAIANRKADIGVGLQASAVPYGLDFIPLFEERYDLVIPEANYHNPRLATALDYLTSAAFRQTAGGLAGYNLQPAGQEQQI